MTALSVWEKAFTSPLRERVGVLMWGDRILLKPITQGQPLQGNHSSVLSKTICTMIVMFLHRGCSTLNCCFFVVFFLAEGPASAVHRFCLFDSAQKPKNICNKTAPTEAKNLSVGCFGHFYGLNFYQLYQLT